MDSTAPRRVMKVGWIAPGRMASDPAWPASLFFADAHWIDFERELFTFPAPGVFCDRVRYHLEPGAVATLYVNDTGVPTLPNNLLQPWDRNMALWQQASTPVSTPGAGAVVVWTYTVPAGRKLWVSRALVRCYRSAVPTAAVQLYSQLLINGAKFLFAALQGAPQDQYVSDEHAGAPVILPAGTVLDAYSNNQDTGGTARHVLEAYGFLFDS